MKQTFLVYAAEAFVLLVLALTQIGCGNASSNRLPVVPVEGQLVVNGQPIKGAMVVFHPKDAVDHRHISARATTDVTGKFKLTTYEREDGAPVGNYVVTVAYYQPVRQDEGLVPGPNVLPAKHASPATSDLKVAVAPGVTQPLILTITR